MTRQFAIEVLAGTRGCDPYMYEEAYYTLQVLNHMNERQINQAVAEYRRTH